MHCQKKDIGFDLLINFLLFFVKEKAFEKVTTLFEVNQVFSSRIALKK